MIRRPPRSTLSSSSAASDVYKRQYQRRVRACLRTTSCRSLWKPQRLMGALLPNNNAEKQKLKAGIFVLLCSVNIIYTVSYTHLRAHETPEHLVCRLLLEKKKKKKKKKRIKIRNMKKKQHEQ
eukprot:TRINITY_DN44135_c0_g1_i2.p1 TRINITY_DN44135_c0_g1~~TRINITY_DN44135_c0_g1_i2.p1  ORF type:complete len:123 (-),score=37.84 TRINITY_DN44135_c0_g1_i2:43-411(-)